MIIPEHSLKENNSNYNSNFLSPLPKNFDSIKDKFSLIVACLGGFCVQKRNWVTFFENNKIPWITGAWLHDTNALQRIRDIFSRFEFVATNSIGSHIAYAGYCGCKVSYFGKGSKPKNIDEYLKTPVFKMYPKLIQYDQRVRSFSFIKENYNFLMKEPQEASDIKEWSSNILGYKNKVNCSKLAEIVGWNIKHIKDGIWEYIENRNKGIGDYSSQT